MSKKLDKLFNNAKKIPITDKTKIVIMSDCHRGAGDNYDNFIRNQNIFNVALQDYYKKGFTYLELGDGDEMWEVKNYKDIVEEHIDTFKILKKFHDENRLIMFHGNHDLDKKSKKIMDKYFSEYYDPKTMQNEPLLKDLETYEALILVYHNNEIFLIHGHQVDLLNSTLWRLSKFLVRNVWRYLERIGIKDPTSAAKNYRVTNKTEKSLRRWSVKNNKILIAGHTHRPIFPKIGESLYFNDGSCIHPNGITCIEIENGKISLVKWLITVKYSNLLSVSREVIAGEIPIIDFYK